VDCLCQEGNKISYTELLSFVQLLFMSHEHHEIICPNCGYHAVENYCARCGQETHLHKETFWGLVVHFLGHYFHYDSKFWKTMKALWFSPGKLTIAYWNKQRMRYIAPVSLYIFISAVYFLVSFEFSTGDIEVNNHKTKTGMHFTNDESNGVFTIGEDTSVISGLDSSTKDLVKNAIKNNREQANKSKGLVGWLNSRSKKIKERHGNAAEFVRERANHDWPKLFFFMIPVMALFLKILYARRKDLFFVDHAIFALHFHSFWFSLFLFKFINISQRSHSIIMLILSITAMIYMIRALRKVYSSSQARAIFYMLFMAFGYVLSLGTLVLLDLFFIFCTA